VTLVGVVACSLFNEEDVPLRLDRELVVVVVDETGGDDGVLLADAVDVLRRVVEVFFGILLLGFYCNNTAHRLNSRITTNTNSRLPSYEVDKRSL